MKNEREGSVQQHIIKVTLDLISREGFDAVTVRRIASLADVNVAMINYYFRSKENLINEVVKALVDSLQKSFSVLSDDNMPPRQRLKIFLMRYAQGLQAYPDLAHRVVTQGKIFDSQRSFVDFMKNMGIIKILDIIQEITGETDLTKRGMIAMQLIGSVAFPVFMKPVLQEALGILFLPYEPYYDTLESYIDLLIERSFRYDNDSSLMSLSCGTA